MRKFLTFIFIFAGTVSCVFIFNIVLYTVVPSYRHFLEGLVQDDKIPVVTVTERITEISKGDFTVKLVPEGNNEITTLSESLNEYIEKMRTTLNSLSDISIYFKLSCRKCSYRIKLSTNEFVEIIRGN